MPDVTGKELVDKINGTMIMGQFDDGLIDTDAFNSMSPNKRAFIILVAFGGYKADKAISLIDPSISQPKMYAARLMAHPLIKEFLNTIIEARNRQFTLDIQTARERALSKLEFIMATTDDNALAATCAKTIIDKAEAMSKNIGMKEEQSGPSKVVFSFDMPQSKNTSMYVEPLTEEEVRQAEEKFKSSSPQALADAIDYSRTDLTDEELDSRANLTNEELA